MIRKHFVEREYVFNKIKSAVNGKLSDKQIIDILDKNSVDDDLTFIFFQIKYHIKIIVINNVSGCDVAIADLRYNAKEFLKFELLKFKKHRQIS